MPKLTKIIVDAARPADKPVLIWDSDIKGFFLRVMPSGTRTYGLYYRADGKQAWFTLGRHGPLTPHQARALAMQRLGEVAAGRDPGAEKKAKRQAAETAREHSFEIIADCFLDHCESSLRAASLRVYGAVLRGAVPP